MLKLFVYSWKCIAFLMVSLQTARPCYFGTHGPILKMKISNYSTRRVLFKDGDRYELFLFSKATMHC